MTSRDNDLWLQLWRDRETDFHQTTANPFLSRFWPRLDHAKGSRIFVPLCGKSLDMVWLANQGYEVIGVELSPIAVKAFFKENHWQPRKRRNGKFTIWSHRNIRILCGDYFSLTQSDLGKIDTVYDRAALTALPEDTRRHYVAQLRLIVPETANVFLLTIEDAEDHETLERALGVDEEIETLYRADFDINLVHVESVVERDPASSNPSPKRTEYKVYQLSSRPVIL